MNNFDTFMKAAFDLIMGIFSFAIDFVGLFLCVWFAVLLLVPLSKAVSVVTNENDEEGNPEFNGANELYNWLQETITIKKITLWKPPLVIAFLITGFLSFLRL